MDAETLNLPAQTLLQHGQFVRALARGLLGDEQLAEDVVQDTWVRWLERPPRERSKPHTWLSRVGRNVAINTARSRSARRAREQAVAHSEAIDDPAEGVAQADLLRSVVASVLALDEPIRSVVLLTYFHGWSAPRIAEQRGVPASTVRTQLKRGLAQLRQQLDADNGDREQWALALGGIASGSLGRSGVLGALTSAVWVKVGAAALLASFGYLYFTSSEVSEPGPIQLAAAAPAEVAPQEPEATAAAPVAPQQDEREVAVEPAATTALRVTGSVRDLAYPALGLEARPTAGLPMVAYYGKQRPFGSPDGKVDVTLDEAGRFAFEFEDPGYRPVKVRFVSKADGPYQSLSEERAIAEGQNELLDAELARAAFGLLPGLVVDGAGEPLAGAELVLKGRAEEVSVKADDAGRFEIEQRWRVYGVESRLAGYSVADFAQPQPLTDDDERRLGGWTEMRIVVLPSAALDFRALDAAGQGIANVTLRVGLHDSEQAALALEPSFFGGPKRSVKTDAEGRAHIPNLWADRRLTMRVSSAVEFHNTTLVAGDQLSFEPHSDAARPLILKQGEVRELEARWGPDYQLRGVVLDSSGEPVSQAKLVVHDLGGEGFRRRIARATTDRYGLFDVQLRQRVLVGPLLVIARGPEEEADPNQADMLASLGYVDDNPDAKQGGLAASVRLQLADAEERTFTTELVLAETHVIAGRVLGRDGKPLPGGFSSSRIWAVPSGSGHHFATTDLGTAQSSFDDDGAFQFWNVPPGVYDIHVSEELDSFYSFTSFIHRFPDVASGLSNVELELPEREEVHITLRIAENAAKQVTVLHGKVFPKAGVAWPMSKAEPEASINQAAGWPSSANLNFTGAGGSDEPDRQLQFGHYGTTDAREHKMLPMGPGWYVIGIDLKAEGGARTSAPMATELRYYAPGEYVIEFNPVPAVSVRGRVVAPRPLALSLLAADGAPVALQPRAGSTDLVTVLPTTAAGEFNLLDVPIGSHVIRIGGEAQLARGEFVREFPVEFEPGMAPLELRL